MREKVDKEKCGAEEEGRMGIFIEKKTDDLMLRYLLIFSINKILVVKNQYNMISNK